MVLKRSPCGLVVSTADRFSTRARAAAGAAQQLGYEIRLADRGVLDRMLEPALPAMPWLDVMKELDEEVAQVYSAESTSRDQLSFFEDPTRDSQSPRSLGLMLQPDAGAAADVGR